MDIRERLFQYRSYIPFPFLCVMVIFAQPSLESMVAGLAAVFAGEFLRLWGVAIAGSETRTTDRVGGTFLVTTGPFAYVRNPLYLGNIIVYVGFGLMSFALFPWLPVLALVFFTWEYTMIVSLEEQHLAVKFEGQYERYRRSVPRFVPTLKRYIAENNPQPEIDWKRGFTSEKRTLQAITLLTAVVIVLWYVRG